MKYIQITFIALLFGLSNSVNAQQAFNLESSKIKWIGKEISTKSHYGTLYFSSVTLDFDGETLNAGEFVVDMSTLQVDDLTGGSKKRLEGHLKSDDFFSVENHSAATLVITQPAKPDNELYNLEGTLTIKGITHPIQFTISGSSTSENITAKLVFDRSKYNVRFRSGTFFENLGDKLILDPIELEVTLVKS